MVLDSDVILFLVFGIPGFLFELYTLVSKSLLTKTNVRSKSKDHGSFYFIWFIVICSMSLSAYYVRRGYGYKIFVNIFFRYIISLPLSLCLILMGRFLRQQAIQQLGEWFTLKIHINDKQQLIQSGWYAKMRHPSYTGVLMVFVGLGLLINNWLGLFGMVIPPTFVFLYRISIEEKELREHFGSAYAEYTRKVPAKLIPYVY